MPTGGSTDRARILVAVSDGDRRALLRAWLEAEHDIAEAWDGDAAVGALSAGDLDLVLLDDALAGTTALEACRALRALEPDGGHLPVLLLTTGAEPARRIAALEAGADELVPLPCDRAELALRVRAFLRMRRQHASVRAQLDELRRVSGLRDDLIALVAHDLRGPLGSVVTLLRLALQDVSDPEVHEDLEVALSAAERAREIADDLLQVRLLERGERAPARTLVAVDAVVRDALRPLVAVARARELSVRVGVDGDPVFRLDAPLVRRAVENLLSNAMKHSPHGAEIAVLVRRDGDDLTVDVVDRGPQVPAPLREIVFRTFAPAARRAAGRAYGLGLYLVRLVAEAHGGAASVVDAPGGGALFRLRLSAPQAPPRSATAPPGAPEATA